MKKIISMTIALSLLAGCGAKSTSSVSTSTVEPTPTATPEETYEQKAKDLVATMDLSSKVQQLLMPAVRQWDGSDFLEMNDEVEGMLEKYNFGGIILFSENFSDNEQVINLTQSMQEASVKDGGIPLLIGVDQEGGYIARLTNGTTTVGNMALAASGDEENAKQCASIISQELEALGLNLDFAPSLDVNSNPSNPIIGVRSFSDDPDIVTSFGRQYLAGLRENNVIGTVKHFPGHGDTDTDSHTGLPRIDRTKDEVMNKDLVPFKQLISEDDVDMVMTAHIQFPQIETGTYTSIKDGSTINLPATLSKTWVTDILRGELGFDGVITTDSLLMDAIATNFSTKDSAKLAINAGVNILLMPVELTDSSCIDKIDSYINDIVDMVNNGEINEETINESCVKIIKLKYQRGIMDTTYDDSHTEEMLKDVNSLVGTEQSHQTERNIGDDCVTVVKNDNNVLPYTASSNESVVMISKSMSQKNILDHGFFVLQDEGVIDSSAEVTVINENYGDNYNDCMNAINEADVLIVTSHMTAGNQIDTNNSIRIAYIQQYIHAAKEKGIKVIAISTGVPYDVALLQEADAILCVYNANGASNVDDNFNPIGTYSVNLMCGEDIIFGKYNPVGKLPVNIPNVEDGQFTSDILYERGTGITW